MSMALASRNRMELKAYSFLFVGFKKMKRKISFFNQFKSKYA